MRTASSRGGNERLADLSVGGAFIEGTGATPGSILSLRFKLPGTNDFITCTAMARHMRDHGFGVEFLDLSPDNQRRLGVVRRRALVTALAPCLQALPSAF